MKQFLLLIFAILLGFSIQAQPYYASTTPENKTVILEEFTGVRCGSCPSGHQKIHDLLTEFPTQLIALAYSPENSGLTFPYSGDENLTRTYLNAFYTSSYLGERFMPGGVINRRVWDGSNRIQSRSAWESKATIIMGESSPVNVGLHSIYDAVNNQLIVDVEVYFTADMGGAKLFVHLLEDSIQVNKQAGSSVSPYTLFHVFRENLNTAQWGDPITGPTTQGSLYTTQYVFDLENAIGDIDVNQAHIVAFVNDDATGENLSGKMTDVNSPLANRPPASIDDAQISPNPVISDLYVRFTAKDEESEMTIFNLLGQPMYTTTIYGKGYQQLAFDKNSLNVKHGLYLLKITSGNQSYTGKVVFE
ncbi:MAG TPA: Omp28-related outer membrane protein [Saprospiraceae bacterium]|nr:Omp28-related outer membrane protein [Saprospiraceae bacterium]